MATACLSAKLREAILPGLQGAWDTPDVLSSFRLVFGSVGALRGVSLPIHQSWCRRALAKLFPALQGIPFEYAWYGWIGMPPNALHRYHRLARNTISFSGYNGRGIATGTVFGRELAKLALGHIQESDLPLPLSPVAPVSIRPVREAFYEVDAQVAHLSAARF